MSETEAKFGEFYALQRPASTAEAELQGDILRWGNLIRSLTAFEVICGFYAWIGPLKHADAPTNDKYLDVKQLYIHNAPPEWLQARLRDVEAISLVNTGFVVARAGYA